MAEILLQDITKVFGTDVVAVDHVTLTIDTAEFMVLVGPSGCGKSTLLRMIAGLEPVSEGRIWFGDRDVTHLAPRDRDIAMVFQNYGLYPHMDVRGNIAYGLRVRKVRKPEIKRRVDDVAEMLGLGDFMDRRPAQLSGGQRQRVAIGRAIVREPTAYLMDEPLSNLDAKLRVSTRAELARLHSRLGVTTIYVTHDQVEAMTLGQRVAVMSGGRILQVDTPQALYESPVNLFVAAFIGSPAMSFVEATIDGDVVAFGGYRLPLDGQRRPQARSDDSVILGIRPEGFEVAAFAPAGFPEIEVTVEVLEELGADAYVFFTLEAPRVRAEQVRAAAEYMSLVADEKALFNARVDPRTSARVGDRLRLGIDPRRLYFFDRHTGENLLPPVTKRTVPHAQSHRTTYQGARTPL